MNSALPTILSEILDHKHVEVTQRRQATSLDTLQRAITDGPRCRGFAHSVRSKVDAGTDAVIAEVKRASPSKGLIREHFVPDEIARAYEQAGAACLSVLTDEKFLQGSDKFLQQARSACSLPVLRKDFVVDDYQLYEARALGADCVLLIVAALDQERLESFAHTTAELGMDMLIEVHDATELRRALKLGPQMIGINNRNLHTFDTTLETTFDLLGDIPNDCVVVTESGIHTRDDVARMRAQGVHAFLVGEAFMRADDPGAALQTLFSG